MCLTQEFNKELEVKSALKASVISSGSLILLLSEREHIIKTQKISRSSSAPRTSTPSGNTTIPEDQEPSETSNLNPEDSSSVDVIFPSETNVSSIQNISSEETLSTTERSDANITNEGVISEDPMSSALDLSVKQEMVLSPVLLALQSQLSQVEQDWVEIQTHIPTVQQRLHQVHFSLYFNLSEIIACTASLLTVPCMVGKKYQSVSCSSVWSIISLKENIIFIMKVMQPWFPVSLSSWWNLWGIESPFFIRYEALFLVLIPFLLWLHVSPLTWLHCVLSSLFSPPLSVTLICLCAVSLSLSQSVMESLSPEGLLADVRGWITGAESRLQAAEREGHNTCTAAKLTHLLRTYQVPCCLFISLSIITF